MVTDAHSGGGGSPAAHPAPEPGWSGPARPAGSGDRPETGRYEAVIGLEVHVELGTATKMFCGCSTTFGSVANSQTCPVCLGLPGALPVVNAAAVEFAVRIGLALNCEITPWCRFARKNYFYPDMPKNFQISQYDEPLCEHGWLEVEVETPEGLEVSRVGITRVHMEEDTGKSTHVGGSEGRIHGATYSLVDYNRAGVPLVEIVSEPDLRSPEAARAYVTALRELLRTLGVSEVRMEAGQLRCDVNVSLRPRGSYELGVRTETKNVNSLRSVERAVRSEIARQAVLLDRGERIRQETRHFDEASGETRPGRSKEEANDYRYFPEPDLVPLAWSRADVERVRAALPELPAARRERLCRELDVDRAGLAALEGAGVLEGVAATIAAGSPPAEARSWWLNELAARARVADVRPADLPVSPGEVAELIHLVTSGQLSTALARDVLDGVLNGEGTPAAVMTARGLIRLDKGAELAAAVDAAIAAAPDVAAKVRAGKVAAAGPLVGAVMAATERRADPGAVRALILERLGPDGS